MEPSRIVELGYDAMAGRFAAWQRGVAGSTQLARVEALVSMFSACPDVLELGCGAGGAATCLLAGSGRLTGVDISAEQLRRARLRVPHATFERADVMSVEFAPASFDAVVALYVFNHIPQVQLGELLIRIASWLRPGGYLLASFAARENPGWTGEWLGVPMFFAGCEPRTNRRLVEQAGLRVIGDELETITEPPPEAGEATFHWLLSRRPEASTGVRRFAPRQ